MQKAITTTNYSLSTWLMSALLLLVFIIPLKAQFFTLDFETNAGYTTSIPEFSDGTNDFFTRTDGSNISGGYVVNNPQGSFYFAAQDINGEGADATQMLNITGIDISGKSDIVFKILLAEDDDGTNQDWDEPDFFLIEYQIDGGGFNNLLAVEKEAGGSAFNGRPLIDTDFDGEGDGTEITSDFAEFIASISGTGNTLDLRFTFSLDSGDEDLAIDNIRLEESPIDLQITEIWSGQDGPDLTEDWFEIINNSGTPWVSGISPDLFYDDESMDPADASLITGITDIQPGERVIAINIDGRDPTTVVNEFISVWEEVIDLTGIEVGYFDGSGLGSGGDAVTLWLGDPNTTGILSDLEAYPVANAFSGVSFNVELGAFSVAGENGAVATLQTAGSSGDEPAVGSPGNQEAIEIASEIVINEVDADTEGTDILEFVELFDGGVGNTSLDGFVLVLFNGSDDASYNAFDLDGFSTDANGYFVIGTAGVANVDLVLPNPDNNIQNGADAVALFQGDDTDFPNDTPVTTTNLIDAVVYDTNDGDDAGLLVLLNAGQPQLNEDENDDKDFHSLQRIPNGSGGLRNTESFIAIPPSPGEENTVPPAIIFTEIMYNPASSENDWEWVEIYNTTSEPIDLAGYVFFDDESPTSGANILEGVINPGRSAILYNAEDVSAEDFEAAWGCGINLVAVIDFPSMANGGDKIGLWSSFADYSGDEDAQANAIVSVFYDDGGDWPSDAAGDHSIYLTDLDGDLNDGTNWAESVDGVDTPVGTGYESVAAGGNVGGEKASPGGLFVTQVTIQQIQTVDDPSSDDASTFEGQTVSTEGIITAYYSNPSLMTIQDENGGPFSGLTIFYDGGEFDQDALPLGTKISIKGEVIEFNGLTEIIIDDPEASIKVISNPGMPEPVVLTTGEFDQVDPAVSEQWESVFIKFFCAEVSDMDLGFNEFSFDDGSGEARADDLGVINFMPENGDMLAFIQGIGYFSFGNYKLVPRTDADIMNDPTVTANPQAKLFPDLGNLELDGAEIIAHDELSSTIYVTSGDGIQLVDYGNGGVPEFIKLVDPQALTGEVNNSEVTHVTVHNGLVAISVPNADEQLPGDVIFLDSSGNFLSVVEVGALPDMLVFTPDGTKVLVANEGEPGGGSDPQGSVSIIDVSGGPAGATVTTATFTAFDGMEESLRAEGVRIFPGVDVSDDVEPEYIAVSPDGTTAYIALQEANAIAILDIASETITDIAPLGLKDHSLPGNGLDASDRDDAINIQNWPVFGMYMPDAIATYEVGGKTYVVTANEGDARNEDDRIGGLTLDPIAFPDAAILQMDENLGRLQASNINGDTDDDGDFDELWVYGARSFSIWDENINLVFDSGDDFEQITASQIPELFNSEESDPNEFDGRSDNKGPEPEAVTVGMVNGRICAFIGLERVGGYMVYDVTDPNNPTFLNYVPGGTDAAPEDIELIEGPEELEVPFVVVANEESSTIDVNFAFLKNECISNIEVCGNPGGGSGVFVAHNWTVVGGTSEGFRLSNTDAQTLDIDISGATNGTIELRYEVTDQCGVTAEGFTTVAVNQITGVACNDLVNITVGEDCTAEVSPDAVLEGLSSVVCNDRFYIKVIYPNEGHTINYVKECGTFKYVAYRINGEPDWDDNGMTGDEYPDLEVCWGTLNAEDKTPPTACIAKVVGLYKRPGEVFDPISNADLDCNDGVLPKSTAIDGNGNLDWERADVSLLICTDVDSVLNVGLSWEDPDYPYYMGYPELFDNCGEVNITSVTDRLEDLECNYEGGVEMIPGRLLSARITRTFSFVDDKGNTGTIDQEICFFKPIIYLPDCKEELDVCWYGDVDPENTREELAPTIINSAPYYLNGKCERIYLEEDHICNISATYEDVVLPGPESCGFKVLRTWTILDWCWNESIYENFQLAEGAGDGCPQPTLASWNNKALTYEQHLIIGDSELPIVECPMVDIDWDGDPDPLVYSISGLDCAASFEVPAPKVTNKECGYNYTVKVFTKVPVLWHGVPTGELELVEFTGAQVVENLDSETNETLSVMLMGVPKGNHYLQYIVTDFCGNITEKGGLNDEGGLCPFTVEDNIEPIAVCNDQLNVSIGSGSNGDAGLGFARVYAEDVDEGSNDACSEVFIQVRRFVPQEIAELFVEGSDLALEGYPNSPVTINKPGTEANGQSGFYTYFEDYVDFICADVGQKVVVELGVWDDADMNGQYETGKDNFNSCWLETLVEDKIAPICQAPHDITVRCDEVPFYATLPEDGTLWTELSDSEKDNIRRWFGELQDAFNTYPKAWDNCSADVAMIDVEFDLHCKAGKVVRYFQATDAFGRESSICSQVITLSRYHDYCVTFPKDAEAECANDPDVPGVEIDEEGCDLIAISVQDERFDVPTSSDECYKIFRTYRVLNWCQFEADIDIPGGEGEIGENDDVDDVYFDFTYFDRYTDIPPFIVSRDEDDDGNPGDENVTIHFITNDDAEGGEGVIYVDRNCDPFDGNPSVNGGYWRKANTPQTTSSNTALVAGFYQYTQVIKVFDNVQPEIHGDGESSFPSYTSVNPGEEGKLCTAFVERAIEATDNCTPDGLTLRYILLRPDASLGLGPISLFENGAVTSDGNNFDFSVTGPISKGENVRGYTFSGDFPIGDHEFEISVSDGCGNDDANFIPFNVYDAKAPVPICKSVLSTNLMPVDEDEDGIPDEGSGMIAVWASDFIASDIADCSGEVVYSISRALDIDQGNIEPDSTIKSVIIDCEDMANEVVRVYVYAWDKAGNFDRCESLVTITDANNLCDPIDQGVSIAGLISTEDEEAVADVEVGLSGQMNGSMLTPLSGNYSFNNLQLGQDYTITPVKDNDHRNGVSTFDLVVISKHILGVEPLNSPYKLIAADVNNSRAVTTLDLIQLRKVILSIDTEFSNNTSWRFVDKGFNFTDITNPWVDQFPEIVNVNNIEESLQGRDFVAIKIGDVTGDAKVNNQDTGPRNLAGTFHINMENRVLTMGTEYTVPVTAANLNKIQGYQFTLNFTEGVELIDLIPGAISEEHYGMTRLADGAITTSWNHSEGQQISEDAVLFSLVVLANTNIRLSDVFDIGSRYTIAEAYDNHSNLLDVAIEFGETFGPDKGFELLQNVPNPFQKETVIGFHLPEAMHASIMITDITGRLVKKVDRAFVKGYNQITLTKAELPVTGVLSYTLISDGFTATRQMIITE